jgi:hypothetical protein
MDATIEVRRFKIVDNNAGHSYWFCEICANAVAMVNEPKHENRKEEKSSGG